MSKININDMGGEKKLTTEDLNSVKGGPAYMKLGDIKGEVKDSGHDKWIDVLSVGNSRTGR